MAGRTVGRQGQDVLVMLDVPDMLYPFLDILGKSQSTQICVTNFSGADPSIPLGATAALPWIRGKVSL